MTMRLLAIALVVSVPALASAQSVEIFATTGVVQLWDDEGNIGTGVPLGGGIGFKWPRGWGIEVLAETQKATLWFEPNQLPRCGYYEPQGTGFYMKGWSTAPLSELTVSFDIPLEATITDAGAQQFQI